MDANLILDWERYLRDEVEGLALRSYGSVYPSVDTALSCLDWIEGRGLTVVGIEGFDTDGRHVLPRPGHIAEPGSIVAARETLAGWLGQVQFVALTVEFAETEPPPPSVINL